MAASKQTGENEVVFALPRFVAIAPIQNLPFVPDNGLLQSVDLNIRRQGREEPTMKASTEGDDLDLRVRTYLTRPAPRELESAFVRLRP